MTTASKKPAAKKPAEKKAPKTPAAPKSGPAATDNPFVTVEVGAFQKALADVTSVVERATTLPILGNVMISQRDGTVHLVASNLDMEIRLPHEPVGFSGAFATTTSAHHLHDIFKNLDGGAQAKILLDQDARRLVVTSGSNRFKLPVLPIEDFPQMTMAGEAAVLQMPATGLHDILARHAFAQSSDETRYYLNGIHFHGGADNNLCVAATDGHNLAHEKYPHPVPDHFPAIIIARRTVAVLQKLLASSEEEALVDLEVTASKIHVQIGDHVLIAKLIDGQFPDYSRVIPENNSAIATMDRAQLMVIAKRVQILADAKSSAVRCDFDADKLTLTVATETGEAKSEMAISYGGAPLAIGINGKYLLAQLGVHAGEKIMLIMDDARAPVRIEAVGAAKDGAEKPDFLTVIMPMAI